MQQLDDKYQVPTRVVLDDDGFNLPLHFYYEGLNPDRNMFTSEAIEAVETYERALLEMDSWYCLDSHPQPQAWLSASTPQRFPHHST